MKVKNLILQSIAFAIVVFLLSGSVGFNVDFHYCGGELKSYDFFGKAESCHKKDGVFCPVHQKMMIMGNADKFDCCENESVYFKSDQNLQVQFPVAAIDLQFEKPLMPFVLPISFFQKTRLGKNYHPPPDPDPPPRQRKDVLVWNQSFLC